MLDSFADPAAIVLISLIGFRYHENSANLEDSSVAVRLGSLLGCQKRSILWSAFFVFRRLLQMFCLEHSSFNYATVKTGNFLAVSKRKSWIEGVLFRILTPKDANIARVLTSILTDVIISDFQPSLSETHNFITLRPTVLVNWPRRVTNQLFPSFT